MREEILRVREIKLPGGMGMGTNMCSRAGLYCVSCSLDCSLNVHVMLSDGIFENRVS